MPYKMLIGVFSTIARHPAVFCRLTGFTIPLAHGKGFFFGPVGLLPFQEPINVVVGAPISVEQYTGNCPVCVLS